MFFNGSRLRVAREEVAWAASLDSTRAVSSTTTNRDDSEFWRDRNAFPVVVSARKQKPERRRQCSYVSSTVAFVLCFRCVIREIQSARRVACLDHVNGCACVQVLQNLPTPPLADHIRIEARGQKRSRRLRTHRRHRRWRRWGSWYRCRR